MKVKASICFPDEPDKHMAILRKLLDFYINVDGLAGDTLIDIACEDSMLVIDIDKGFHCLSIPLEKIRKLIKARKT